MDQRHITGFLSVVPFILTLHAPNLKRFVYCTHFPGLLTSLINFSGIKFSNK